MKKITLFAILAFAAFSSSAYAQTVVSGAATATATIITPIAITKVVDMNFGEISINGENGTVELTTAGVRTATGGASLPASSSIVATSAMFTVTGKADYGYSISMPGTITLKHTDNSTVMVVTDINNSVGTSGTLAAGTQDIFVGGTLNLVGAQLAGVYTNTADLKVTVNYN